MEWTRGGRATWPFGGDGFVVSSGLLESIAADKWRACVDQISSGGGDSRVAYCIWFWTGIGLSQIPGKGFSAHRYFERTDRSEMNGASARVDPRKARACVK